MEAAQLTSCYEMIAELLLHPEHRDADRIATLMHTQQQEPLVGGVPLQAFLDHPLSSDSREYVLTLELSPPCPLYLGYYLFDEPTSCKGAGMSGRNRYMLELTALYRHFGFEVQGGELPDYLPLVVDFLGVSLAHRDRDGAGLRRYLIETYVAPGLAPLHKKLVEYKSPYASLIEALGATLEADLETLADTPPWAPPKDSTKEAGRCRLNASGKIEFEPAAEGTLS